MQGSDAARGEAQYETEPYAVLLCNEHGTAVRHVLYNVEDPRQREREMTHELPGGDGDDHYGYYLLRPVTEILARFRDPQYAESHEDLTGGELVEAAAKYGQSGR